MAKRSKKFDFSFKHPIAWGDMDAYGHVNNVIYARYFETARARFFSEKGYWHDPSKPQKEGVILVAQQLKYRKQVRFPATLEIHIGILSSASRGFRMGCVMYDDGDGVVLEAEADLLWVDFTTGRPKRLPVELREG